MLHAMMKADDGSELTMIVGLEAEDMLVLTMGVPLPFELIVGFIDEQGATDHRLRGFLIADTTRDDLLQRLAHVTPPPGHQMYVYDLEGGAHAASDRDS
jgi:hypothetical protein